MRDVGPLTKQAMKCVNDFIARADGNWKVARELWRKELGSLPDVHKKGPYPRAVEAMFKEMEPR